MDRKPYPTDLTPEQVDIVRPLLPPPCATGRPRTWSCLEILNAIVFIVRSGAAWRLLPHDFPPWQTVYSSFRTWKLSGVWQTIHDQLVERTRVQEGRNPAPTAALMDSQSIKMADKGQNRGYDAGKKITGRKRHLLVDTLGLVLTVVVHSANIQDRDGARLLLERAKARLTTLKHIWADGGYGGALIDWVRSTCSWVLEIVRRPAESKGFVVLPRRWVVERTLAWLGRYRRMSKDYEELTDTSEAMIHVAMINLMVRRLARAAAE
jgi:putative transposase